MFFLCVSVVSPYCNIAIHVHVYVHVYSILAILQAAGGSHDVIVQHQNSKLLDHQMPKAKSDELKMDGSVHGQATQQQPTTRRHVDTHTHSTHIHAPCKCKMQGEPTAILQLQKAKTKAMYANYCDDTAFPLTEIKPEAQSFNTKPEKDCAMKTTELLRLNDDLNTVPLRALGGSGSE